MPGSPLIGFTNHDPIRLVAHNLDFWIPPVTEVMEAEMRTWPEVDNGVAPQPAPLNDGFGPHRRKCSEPADGW
jgi:hypothetical protein